MAILESCCFWQNVRKGSFACAFYTLVYFGFSTFMFLIYLKEEQEFLLGRRSQPQGESILEKGDVTIVTVIFNILFLFCSMLMVLASIMLIAGLRYNKRQFLLPWIFFMLCDLLIECAHLIHLTAARHVIFDPIVGFIFTIDFFILCLNLYCLLCVISQYQEYRAQRAEQQPARTKPIVVFTAPEKSKKSQQAATQTNNKRQPRRLLAASPLITSQRLTNFSTITEEEEQQQQQQQQQQTKSNGNTDSKNPNDPNGMGNCEHISENPTSSVGNSENNLRIPIITLDPNSLP